MTTIWLLDFDDVVNANRAGWSAAPFSSTAYDNGKAWRIRWSPVLVQRIWRLHRAGLLIFWATSWCGNTDQLEQILKLPALFSAASARMSDDDKRDAALAVIESGNRLIWTDDAVVPDSGDLYDTLTKDNRALLIRPKVNRGLRPEHMDAIDAFFAKDE